MKKGSWLFDLLMQLNPEQIKAYGDIIDDMILNLGLVYTINNMAKNPKTAKYIRDMIVSIKNK